MDEDGVRGGMRMGMRGGKRMGLTRDDDIRT